MYSQPLNASIAIFPRLRTYFNNGRHTSIKHLTTPFGDAIVSVPGEEIQVLEVLDTTFKSDAFRYGHGVVVEARVPLKMRDLLAAQPSLQVTRMVGNPREVQVNSTVATDDIQQEARTSSHGGYDTATFAPYGSGFASAPATTQV